MANEELEIPGEDTDLEGAPEVITEQDGEDDGRKVKGNLHARLRIVERDKRNIEERFNQLVASLSQPTETYEEVPVIPEFDDDKPFESIHEGLKVTNERIALKEQLDQQREEINRIRDDIKSANEVIVEFAEDHSDYADAIQHMVNTELEEILEENPSLTASEADQILTTKIENLKLGWIRSGKNPAQGLYNRAKRKGYKPQAPKPAGEDGGKNEIRREREREEKGTTVSRVPGRTAAPKMTAERILKMDRKEFDSWRDDLAKEKGGIMKPLKMRDLMPEKLQKGGRDLINQARGRASR